MAAQKLKAFLDQEGVKYVTIQHSAAFAASEVARSAHVAARDFAKTVIIRVDGVPAMLVLPATRRLLLHELREMFQSEQVRLATESELRTLFPDCEVGAMPPFGHLYGMKVYVAASLAHEKEIAFNAGTHTEVIKLSYEDFERLAKPFVLDLVTT
jgi:Ala-tRNA(Pro) deacylase